VRIQSNANILHLSESESESEKPKLVAFKTACLQTNLFDFREGQFSVRGSFQWEADFSGTSLSFRCDDARRGNSSKVWGCYTVLHLCRDRSKTVQG
jgi:hypothetical protein